MQISLLDDISDDDNASGMSNQRNAGGKLSDDSPAWLFCSWGSLKCSLEFLAFVLTLITRLPDK